jgi:hypothetical protein
VREPCEPFSWLCEPRGRRSALALVELAVRRGWLDRPGRDQAHRAILVAVLARLGADPSLPARQAVRVARILLVASGGDRTGRPEATVHPVGGSGADGL